MNNNNSIIRAYVNCFYWIKNSLYNYESRNLGFTSELQTQLSYLIKSIIIDFLQNDDNSKYFTKLIKNRFSKKDNFFKSEINKFRKNIYNTDGITELTILSHIFPYPIIVFDNYSHVKYIYLKGPVNVNKKTIKTYTNVKKKSSTICIKFDFEGSRDIPNKISSIYYK